MNVVVLGHPRGGTSAIAGILRIAGVDMGEDISEITHEDLVMRGLEGDRLAAEIRRRNRERDGAWGWKDPTVVGKLTRPVLEALRTPRFLLILRDPADVADSEVRHAGRERAAATREAMIRDQKLRTFAAEHTVATFRFEDLADDPAKLAAGVAGMVGVRLAPPAICRCLDFLAGGYRRLDGTAWEGPLPHHP